MQLVKGTLSQLTQLICNNPVNWLTIIWTRFCFVFFLEDWERGTFQKQRPGPLDFLRARPKPRRHEKFVRKKLKHFLHSYCHITFSRTCSLHKSLLTEAEEENNFLNALGMPKSQILCNVFLKRYFFFFQKENQQGFINHSLSANYLQKLSVSDGGYKTPSWVIHVELAAMTLCLIIK